MFRLEPRGSFIVVLLILGATVLWGNSRPTSNHRPTQGFGDSFGNNRGHLGEDYGAVEAGRAGDRVFAIRAGKVYASALNGTADRTCVNPSTGRTGFGNYVVIEHPYPKSFAPNGALYSVYAHLDTRLVSQGDEVREGQSVGTMGCTGFATAVHLHVGIMDREPPGAGYRGDQSFTDDRTQRAGSNRWYYKPSLFFSAPTLRIDGGTSRTRPQGETFTFTGSGYTPRGTVSRLMRGPDGNDVPLTPAITADASGNVNWTFTPNCSNPTGEFTIWAIDDATGRGWFWSNHVTESVTPGATCGSTNTDEDITALANTVQDVRWFYITTDSKWYIVSTARSNPSVLQLARVDSNFSGGIRWKPINNYGTYAGYPAAGTQFSSLTVSNDGRTISFGSASSTVTDPDVTRLAGTRQTVQWFYINPGSRWYIVGNGNRLNPPVLLLKRVDETFSGGIRWKPINNYGAYAGYAAMPQKYEFVTPSDDGRIVQFGSLRR